MIKFIFGRNNWKDLERAQENCFLLTNGLGGYSSLSMAGSNTRGDHAIFMAALQAPNVRYHLLTNVHEYVYTGNHSVSLASQQYVNRTKNQEGFLYLNTFSLEYLPKWVYQVQGIEIIKTIVMVQDENTMGIHYHICTHGNPEGILCVRPLLRFTMKNDPIKLEQEFQVNEDTIESQGIKLYYRTNGKVNKYKTTLLEDLYFDQDSCDGRDSVGCVAVNHDIVFDILNPEEDFYLIYSLEPIDKSIEEMIASEEEYQKKSLEKSGIKNDVAQCLVKSAVQYIAKRESTNGKTLIAGFPFFEDWGRDTMIALIGCTISTGRFDDCKSILRTFMTYCNQGLMPNLFPEGGKDPRYNTVDASLLFMEAVYQYYLKTKDVSFLIEAYSVMESIIYWYRKGTDFHIKMDLDGLIVAGKEKEQVTWMDVRIDDILPTPRHGKPVEINAYWYNALMIMANISPLIEKDEKDYRKLADQVKESFRFQFWNTKENCLKDFISDKDVSLDNDEENQIRCNQVWVLSLSFCMMEKEEARCILNKIYEHLYTPLGLRSLSPFDQSFHDYYMGDQFHRDLAYHQGTVWAYPLGAYLRAILRFSDNWEEAEKTVIRQLEPIEAGLFEGCLGHIAEIYDGKYPVASKGCYAQAWSVGELLRVYAELEKKID